MMSLRSWLSLLVIYITYLILGMFSFRALEYCVLEEDGGKIFCVAKYDVHSFMKSILYRLAIIKVYTTYFQLDKGSTKPPWMELRFDHSRPSQNQTEKRLQWIMQQKIHHALQGKKSKL